MRVAVGAGGMSGGAKGFGVAWNPEHLLKVRKHVDVGEDVHVKMSLDYSLRTLEVSRVGVTVDHRPSLVRFVAAPDVREVKLSKVFELSNVKLEVFGVLDYDSMETFKGFNVKPYRHGPIRWRLGSLARLNGVNVKHRWPVSKAPERPGQCQVEFKATPSWTLPDVSGNTNSGFDAYIGQFSLDVAQLNAVVTL